MCQDSITLLLNTDLSTVQIPILCPCRLAHDIFEYLVGSFASNAYQCLLNG